MIDHFYLPVTDLTRSHEFYDQLLGTLGIEGDLSLGNSVVFGLGRPGAFWIYPVSGRHLPGYDPCGSSPEAISPLPHLHVAFRAESRDRVHAFAGKAESLGAEVLLHPQLLLSYHRNYFAAFVRDPDGHDIEAVCSAIA